jgi:hypothetical protein
MLKLKIKFSLTKFSSRCSRCLGGENLFNITKVLIKLSALKNYQKGAFMRNQIAVQMYTVREFTKSPKDFIRTIQKIQKIGDLKKLRKRMRKPDL